MPGTPRLPLSPCTEYSLTTMSPPSTTAATRRPAAGRALRRCCRNYVLIFNSLPLCQTPEPIVAVGFSIGSGVAAYLARHRPVAGLILVTPFDSLEALARDLYWWAPVRLLMRHHMPTIEFAHGSRAPTALITAARDGVVPGRRSAPLRAANANLLFQRVIDAGHNDLYDRPAFSAAIREALGKI